MEKDIGKEIGKKIKELRLKKAEVAQLFGVTPKTIYNWTHGVGPVPSTKMAMAKAFIEGKLSAPTTEQEAISYSPFKVVNVPIVTQYAYGGYLTGYADPEYVQSLPVIPFMAERETSGNYVAFEVHGDSMNDGTKDGFVPGEIVICREVEPYLWRDSKLHINRRDFVIVHKDGILIKRITEHDIQNHTITIHSLNPEYEDKVLDLADVRQIFSIVTSQQRRDR